MKNIKKYLLVFTSLWLFVSCQEDKATFGDLNAPTNLTITAELVGKTAELPNGDGSGFVNFTAKAANAISYKIIFGDGETKNAPSGEYLKRYTKTGTHIYTVTVLASGKGGVTTTANIDIEVFSDFNDDEAVTFLTGGASKKWYWSASEPGHLGVGKNINPLDPNSPNHIPSYYEAAAWEKASSGDSSCLYENELTFSLDNGTLKYTLNNNGSTFFNTAFQSVAGGSAGFDFCYSYDTSGTKTVNLSPSESVVAANGVPGQTRGTMMNFSDGGFMGYYIGQSSYEILSITANRLYVRAVMGGNPALAWYHVFTTTKPTQTPDVDFTNLVWSDEFNTDGAPDSTKWGYDLVAGGWGNGEAQTYTNASANVSVSGGNLKITAIKSGSTYTSTRLKSENKYEFTYGKVEVRAKLPFGGGTWPAIWMLGQNYATNIWPACGEIDIMEHKGNDVNKIYGTLHYPGNFGGNANGNSTTITGATTEFHIYKTIWTATSIKIYVDDLLYHSVANNNSLPFNSDFFLILNVAMGGTFGGAIDPTFTQSSMEIDYVRVYQ